LYYVNYSVEILFAHLHQIIYKHAELYIIINLKWQ